MRFNYEVSVKGKEPWEYYAWVEFIKKNPRVSPEECFLAGAHAALKRVEEMVPMTDGARKMIVDMRAVTPDIPGA